jgi:cell division protein FtsL
MAMAAMTTAAAGMEMMGTRTRGQRGRTMSIAERNSALMDIQRKGRRIVKADDPERRREMRNFAAVMGVLFLLVMVYVWQHFAAIEVGYHVETQKSQVEQLREDNRQLRLTEAQLSDPGRIDRIAKQLGLDTPQPGQVVRPDGDDPNAPVMARVSSPAVPTY